MLNVWTIDLCRIWVAPPAHSLVVRWYVHRARVIKNYGKLSRSLSLRLWKTKERLHKWIHMHTCISLIMILLFLMKCLYLIYCMVLWNFMFVLAELWLITYVRDVGTKGKQVLCCFKVSILNILRFWW